MLIQPGAAPRQALRYHLTKGTHTTSQLTYDVDVKDDGQGGPAPTLVFELETTVDDVLPDGAAKLRLTIGHTSVRDRPGSEATSNLVREAATAIQGVIITQVLAPDGQVSDSQIQTAAALPDKLHAQIDNVSKSLERVAMRLPSEPVGIGATWRERKTLPEGGIRADSEIVYTLTALTGDTLTYTSTGLSTSVPHTIEQDHMKVEVTSAHGRADAKGTIDLSRYALDVTSTTAFTTTMNVLAPKDTPGAGSSTIDVTMAIAIAPKPATPDDARGQPDDASGHASTAPPPPSPPPSTPGASSDQGAHKAP
jgi:Family of unknown function (DUF6263)